MPDTAPRRADRLKGPVQLLLATAAATALLAVRDPHSSGSYGFCPVRLATGYDCPGCGGLRAVNDLTHGDLVAAAHSNLLLVASLPLVAVLWSIWFLRRWRGHSRPLPRPLVLTAATLYTLALVAFTIVRNLPAGHWMYAGPS